jgi:hypothetical protein
MFGNSPQELQIPTTAASLQAQLDQQIAAAEQSPPTALEDSPFETLYVDLQQIDAAIRVDQGIEGKNRHIDAPAIMLLLNRVEEGGHQRQAMSAERELLLRSTQSHIVKFDMVEAAGVDSQVGESVWIRLEADDVGAREEELRGIDELADVRTDIDDEWISLQDPGGDDVIVEVHDARLKAPQATQISHCQR